MSEKIKYRDGFDLNSALLYKNDLFVLEKILKVDPRTDRINIEVSFGNTIISAESFEELLSNPSLPTSTNDLSIHMRHYIEGDVFKDISNGIKVDLNKTYIRCQIHSDDQTWFLGKRVQIKEFFKQRKPWYLWLNKLLPIYPSIMMALLIYSSDMFGKKQYFQMIVPVIFFIFLGVVSTLIYKLKLFPFIKIYLQERKRGKFGFNEWCSLITALAGLVTLLQVLSTLFK